MGPAVTNALNSDVGSGSATFLGILNANTEFSASRTAASETFGSIDSTIVTLSFPTASLVDFDPEGVRAFKISQGGLVEEELINSEDD